MVTEKGYQHSSIQHGKTRLDFVTVAHFTAMIFCLLFITDPDCSFFIYTIFDYVCISLIDLFA